MKTQFKSTEIAHIWAHKSAPFGKSPGAMSFNGEVFLSYSTAIARHITHKGKSAIVLNDTSFSVTTGKHMGKVYSAIHGLDIPRFHYAAGMGTSLDVTGKELFEYAVEQSADALKRAEKARQRKASYEARAAGWLEDAQAINLFFGLRRKVDSHAIERLKEASAKAEREAAKQEREREEKQRAEQFTAFECWKIGAKGEPDDYFNPRLFPVAFRIESDELVSTLGARIPLEDAKRTLAFVTAIRSRNESWQRNGQVHRVGHYQLDSITSEGVKAGCHVITWSEVERLTGILL